MNYNGELQSNGYKIFQTCIAIATYLSVGCASTLIGSALLDLQLRTQTDFVTISHIIPVRCAGHIFGSLLSGFLDNRFNINLILFSANLLSGLCLIIAPWFEQVNILIGSLFFTGIGNGIADIFCNTFVVQTWKEKSTKWLQLLYMSYGIGALITPLIARPFIIPTNETESVTYESTISLLTPDDVYIQWAFFIFGLVHLVLTIPQIICYLRDRSIKNLTDKIDIKQSVNVNKQWKIYGAVALVALVAHLVFGVEMIIGSLGAAFSVKSDLKMAKQKGVFLASVFWICFSFYRLIFIPLSFYIKEQYLIISNLLIALISIFIIVPWSNYNQSLLWSGFVLMGIGISPIISVSFGRLTSFFPISGRISSIIFISGIAGESIHPAIAASLLSINPLIFLYYLGFLAFLCVLMVAALLFYCNKVLIPISSCNGTVELSEIKNDKNQGDQSTLSIKPDKISYCGSNSN